MHRLDQREFLQEVLRQAGELPPGLGERLEKILDGTLEDRADAIRRLFEELARE
jgi:hypothetical protein